MSRSRRSTQPKQMKCCTSRSGLSEAARFPANQVRYQPESNRDVSTSPQPALANKLKLGESGGYVTKLILSWLSDQSCWGYMAGSHAACSLILATFRARCNFTGHETTGQGHTTQCLDKASRFPRVFREDWKATQDNISYSIRATLSSHRVAAVDADEAASTVVGDGLRAGRRAACNASAVGSGSRTRRGRAARSARRACGGRRSWVASLSGA